MNQYREAKREYIRARNNLEELETLLFRTSSPISKAKVKSTPKQDTISIYMDELIRLQKQCEEKQGRALRKMAEILNLIENTENDISKEILTKRYIHGLRPEQIAIDLNYEYSYLTRLHNRAIEEVFKIEKR